MFRDVWIAAVATLFSTFVVGASLADQPYLSLDGEVATSLSLSKADFESLPRKTVTITASTGEVRYEGVDLAALLRKVGVPLQGDLKGSLTSRYLHAEGDDGFSAVIALPEFDDAAFLVADTINGAPLGAANGPLQLITTNEKRRSRWVKHLTLLRIRTSQK